MLLDKRREFVGKYKRTSSFREATFLSTASQCRLTALEHGIVASITRGYTDKDIALKYFLSQEAVKHHLNQVFNKLGVENRLELVIHAVGSGLLNRIP